MSYYPKEKKATPLVCAIVINLFPLLFWGAVICYTLRVFPFGHAYRPIHW